MSTNDELRKLIAEQMDFVLSQTPEALAAENAKLRELVRDMWAWQDALPYERHAEIRSRMSELGVEV